MNIFSSLRSSSSDATRTNIFDSPEDGGGDNANGQFYDRWNAGAVARLSYSFTAAAAMAMDHFNNRDSSVVSELAELDECSVYFPDLLLAKKSTSLSAVGALWEVPTVAGHLEDDIPCAILGPLDDESSWHVQAIASAMHTPQLDDYNIDNGGTAASARAHAMVEFLHRQRSERTYLSVWHSDEKRHDETLVHSVKSLGEGMNVKVSLFDAVDRVNEANMHTRLGDMKANGVKTIFINGGEPFDLVQLAAALEELAMLTSDYVYILSPYLAPPDLLAEIYGEQAPESPIAKLLTGSLVFDRLDGFHVNGENDSFLKSWRQQSYTFALKLNAMMSTVPEEANDAHFFQTNFPLNGASYVYDSIMAIGLGGCRQQRQGNTGFDSLAQSDLHIEGIAMSTFHGASGSVTYDQVEEERLVRSSTNTSFGVYNIRPKQGSANSGASSFEAILTSLWTEESGWNDLDGVHNVYRDGSTSLPNLLREVEEEHHISNWVRVLGLSFMSVSWVICVFSMILLFLLRNDTVIRRSQPFYLQLACAASILTSTSIYTISWDEGAGWSDSQLDIACGAMPWFFFKGQILTVAAMFTKLWRVYRVLKFRQRTISAHIVAGQILVPLAVTTLILAVWTAIDPYTWEREWVSEAPTETYGRCQSGSMTTVFLVQLVFIIVYANTFTLLFAWRTKAGVPEDFQDNSAVIYIMAIHLQTWILGAPAAVMSGTSMSANAIYAWRVVAILVFSLSSVLVLVVPKLSKAFRLRGSGKRYNLGKLVKNLILGNSSDSGTETVTGSGGKIDELEDGDGKSIMQSPYMEVNQRPNEVSVGHNNDDGADDDERVPVDPLLQGNESSIPPPVSSIQFEDLPPVSSVEIMVGLGDLAFEI